VTLVLPICTQGSCQQNSSASQANATQATSNRTDSLQAKLRAHLEHYWDGTRTDTLSAEALEQRLVDYIFLCAHADKEMRQQCWQTIAKTFPDEQPNRMVADYLGDEESPLYAPEMLEEYLATIAETFNQGSIDRIRVDYLLGEIRKNKPGQKIADLALVMAGDRKRATLHELIEQSGTDCKVLFYDPECEECATLISRLTADPDAGCVIAVSVMDTAKSLPAGWRSCIAADPEQLDARFYLPRLPRLYTVAPDLTIRH